METQIITLSAGKGPAECCWVVAQVLKQILIEIRKIGFDYRILHEELGEQTGTYQSVTLSVSGTEISGFLNEWTGTIQWSGNSMYRKNHKRKNWFVSIVARKDIQHTEMDLGDLKIQTMRSGGKGGQHVNKVSTAVRITHLPTGTSVTCSEERSQLRNKKIALEKLASKLDEKKWKEAGERASADWVEKLDVERGNPIKVFSSTHFKPVSSSTSKTFGSKRQQLKQELKKRMSQEE